MILHIAILDISIVNIVILDTTIPYISIVPINPGLS